MSDNTCTKTVLAPVDMTASWVREQVEAANNAGFLNFEVLTNQAAHRELLTEHGFKISGTEQRSFRSEAITLMKWKLRVQDAGDGVLTQFASGNRNKRRD
jgi:hypothetical protein